MANVVNAECTIHQLSHPLASHTRKIEQVTGRVQSEGRMQLPLKKVILSLALAVFLAGEPSANAGNPIGDFFKRLGDSIAHPRSTPPPRRKPQKSTTGKNQNDKVQTAPQDAPPPMPTAPPSPTPAPISTRTPMPVPLVIRAAATVPPTKKPRRDLPYGIPVPNKAGFVTSPYAPKSGFVDVRSFPSGTEVKDPYTGKIFLTP